MTPVVRQGRVDKAPAKKVPAKKAVKKAPAKKVPAKKGPVKKAGARKSANTSDAQSASCATATGGPAMAVSALPAPPTDPLIVLGLTEPLSTAQLKRAWCRYAARHHPDQGGDAATFARGRAAYEELRAEVRA